MGDQVRGSANFDAREDALLLDLVKKHGNDAWMEVAAELPGRTPRQCRNRYTMFLAPGANSDPWTPEEDERLKKYYGVHGPKWAMLRQYFPGHTDLNIKNRFAYLTRNESDIPELAAPTDATPPQSPMKRKLKPAQLAEPEQSSFGPIASMTVDSLFQTLPFLMKRCLLLETILESHNVPLPPPNVCEQLIMSDDGAKDDEDGADLPPLPGETPDRL
jgi:hypothetical protein